jgi:hypothetical protein
VRGWPTWRIGTNLCEVLAIAVYPPADQRAIGLSLRLSTGAVNVVSVALVGLGGWPLPDELDDTTGDAAISATGARVDAPRLVGQESPLGN